MSTESAAAAALAPAPSKTPHTLKLSRAALYILEGCLQEIGPCTTPAKIVLWSKVYGKVRRTNSRLITTEFTPQGHDFEKPMMRNEGEADLAFQKRSNAWNEAFSAWQKEPADPLHLSDKYRDCCRDAVKYVVDNSKDEKARVKIVLNEHSASLLVALGLAEAEADDE